MAAKRLIAREKRRTNYAKNRYSNRLELKKIISSPNSSAEEVMNAVIKLQKRKLDESLVRKTNRCESCGRGKGVFRRFGLCRCCLRNSALFGYIPGLVKSSW
jgi:small subunit ribosomal protein S14